MLMEQSRKSSEMEKIALQQAQDAITEKDAAVAEAAAATTRKKFMLQLLTDASLDMAGMLHYHCRAFSFPFYLSSLFSLVFVKNRFFFGCYY